MKEMNKITRWFLALMLLSLMGIFSHGTAAEKGSTEAEDARKAQAQSFYNKPHLVDLESSKVIIYPDGTWMPYTIDGKLIIEGTSDVGDNITIKLVQDENGDITRSWEVSAGGGLVEVFVSRLRYSFQNKKCIPTIGLRNFNQTGITNAVVNVMFRAPLNEPKKAYKHTGMSLLFVNLDPSEQSEKQGTPVFVDKGVTNCDNLDALVSVSQCNLKNGISCNTIVRVSPFGSIPIVKKSSTKAIMDFVEGRDTGKKYTVGE